MKKAAIYARVSTSGKGQDVEMQVRDLRSFAQSRGFEVYEEFCDCGVSGRKDSRPALDRLMSNARKKKFDVVLCWRFDRFARSTKHLVTALDEFKHLGIDFISYQENIDTSSPMGKAMFTIVSAIAELEVDIIKERILAGLSNAKGKGIKLGRPKRLNLNRKELQELRGKGLSFRQIAKRVNACPASVYKTLSN